MPAQTLTLSFPGAHGALLAARLDLPPAAAPIAYALFAHCFTCSKETRAANYVSAALAGRGIAVLRFDFTGLGASAGDRHGCGAGNARGQIRPARARRSTRHPRGRAGCGRRHGYRAVTLRPRPRRARRLHGHDDQDVCRSQGLSPRTHDGRTKARENSRGRLHGVRNQGRQDRPHRQAYSPGRAAQCGAAGKTAGDFQQMSGAPNPAFGGQRPDPSRGVVSAPPISRWSSQRSRLDSIRTG